MRTLRREIEGPKNARTEGFLQARHHPKHLVGVTFSDRTSGTVRLRNRVTHTHTHTALRYK